MNALAQPVAERDAEEDIRIECRAEARARLANRIGILRSLTPEQLRLLATTNAPEGIGSQEFAKELER